MGQQVSESAAESRFRSRSEHALDEKGRLNIPARFREVLQAEYGEILMVTNWEKSLKAFPSSVWLTMEDKLTKEARSLPKISGFVRYVISGVVECPLDKQGRILLPGPLRDEFKLEKDVVLVGMLDHFEIWDKAAWQEETRSTRNNFKDYEQGLASLGIL